jgi:hypothetical protein
MNMGKLPNGSRGFDCNNRVSYAQAQKFKAAGYSFAVRYVRRGLSASRDISPAEMVALLEAGLSIMLVQHVALPGWRPTATLGATYGATAEEEAQKAGYPLGCTLWCDLEGVASSSAAIDVKAYCNAWYDKVKAAGYIPGLYVGDSPGLNAKQLYYLLRFQAYWRAYNLNADQVPVVRGVQMRQYPYPKPERRVKGISFEYDENVIQADKLGGSPVLCVPPFDV